MAVLPQITPQLEQLCETGAVCLIEELLLNGVCQTVEKCEAQPAGLFLMPLYPWGRATLKADTYTVMVAQIREVKAMTETAATKSGSQPVHKALKKDVLDVRICFWSQTPIRHSSISDIA